VVSGGHTDLYYCPQRGQYRTLGRTRDDAAGECFDKVAKMMHLGYPGGPIIDRLAQGGDPQSVAFPRAMLTKKTYDFSFSGLKTAVRSHLLSATDSCDKQLFKDDTFWPLPQSSDWAQQRNDILASFQQAVVDVLVGKTLRAAKETQAQAIAVVGGVACNSMLRHYMNLAGKAEGLPIFFPSPRFCTDNAAMIACVAHHRYLKTPQNYEQQCFLDLEAHANLTMPHMSIAETMSDLPSSFQSEKGH
jgi:N6-L-threonylcarbamoyladenine synthase